MTLAGRVALVTGGGRGIGRAISLALAEDGADVAVGYVADEASAKEVVAAVEGLGRRSLAAGGSVDDPGQVEALVARVTAELGPVDILVSNAGIASRGRAVADTPAAELARVVGVLALGSHYLCRAVLPGMRGRARGDIVMVSSAATGLMPPLSAPYNMGKAALEALAFTLAKEERAHGIRVNVVAPDVVDTDMGRRLVRAVLGSEDMDELGRARPFGRLCCPADVADMVRFLVSDRAGYVTGQKITIDGGDSPVHAALMANVSGDGQGG